MDNENKDLEVLEEESEQAEEDTQKDERASKVKTTSKKVLDIDNVIIKEIPKEEKNLTFNYAIIGICLVVIILSFTVLSSVFTGDYYMAKIMISLIAALGIVISLRTISENKNYVPKLKEKNLWTAEELMELTGKNKEETQIIIERILSDGFVVSENCYTRKLFAKNNRVVGVDKNFDEKQRLKDLNRELEKYQSKD